MQIEALFPLFCCAKIQSLYLNGHIHHIESKCRKKNRKLEQTRPKDSSWTKIFFLFEISIQRMTNVFYIACHFFGNHSHINSEEFIPLISIHKVNVEIFHGNKKKHYVTIWNCKRSLNSIGEWCKWRKWITKIQ